MRPQVLMQWNDSGSNGLCHGRVDSSCRLDRNGHTAATLRESVWCSLTKHLKHCTRKTTAYERCRYKHYLRPLQYNRLVDIVTTSSYTTPLPTELLAQPRHPSPQLSPKLPPDRRALVSRGSYAWLCINRHSRAFLPSTTTL